MLILVCESLSHDVQEMQSKGFTPNVVSYNILIAVHAKQLEPAKSGAWLHAMQDSGITPDVVWNLVH